MPLMSICSGPLLGTLGTFFTISGTLYQMGSSIAFYCYYILSRDSVPRHCLAGDQASYHFGFHATTDIHSIFRKFLHLMFFWYKINPNKSD